MSLYGLEEAAQLGPDSLDAIIKKVRSKLLDLNSDHPETQALWVVTVLSLLRLLRQSGHPEDLKELLRLAEDGADYILARFSALDLRQALYPGLSHVEENPNMGLEQQEVNSEVVRRFLSHIAFVLGKESPAVQNRAAELERVAAPMRIPFEEWKFRMLTGMTYPTAAGDKQLRLA